jgi:predicted CopG family antitoxin
LNEDVYRALKATADRSHKSLSNVVEELAYRARLVS